MTILTLAVVDQAGGDNATETSSVRSRLRCRKPSREQLMEQLINATSSYRRARYQDTPWLPDQWNGAYFDNREYNLCGKMAELDWTDGQSRPLRQRSLCPWITVNVTPPRRYDRFPRAIAEARCICRRCQMSGSTYQCLPIYHPMIVLRKTNRCDENNFAVYRPARHLVAVGCSCADTSQSL